MPLSFRNITWIFWVLHDHILLPPRALSALRVVLPRKANWDRAKLSFLNACYRGSVLKNMGIYVVRYSLGGHFVHFNSDGIIVLNATRLLAWLQYNKCLSDRLQPRLSYTLTKSARLERHLSGRESTHATDLS